MKKIIIILVIAVGIAGSAFTVSNEKGAATVAKVEGLYVFIYALPSGDHDYLGSIKAGMTWGGTFSESLIKIIKRTKKEYPDADGIVFQQGDWEKVDVIKYKD